MEYDENIYDFIDRIINSGIGEDQSLDAFFGTYLKEVPDSNRFIHNFFKKLLMYNDVYQYPFIRAALMSELAGNDLYMNLLIYYGLKIEELDIQDVPYECVELLVDKYGWLEN